MADDGDGFGTNRPHPMRLVMAEQRRLAILRVLDGVAGPMANDEVVSLYLAQLALGCSRRDLRECLADLARAGLIRSEARGELMIVELTRDGSEVARGLARSEGIPVPLADCPYG